MADRATFPSSWSSLLNPFPLSFLRFPSLSLISRSLVCLVSLPVVLGGCPVWPPATAVNVLSAVRRFPFHTSGSEDSASTGWTTTLMGALIRLPKAFTRPQHFVFAWTGGVSSQGIDGATSTSASFSLSYRPRDPDPSPRILILRWIVHSSARVLCVCLALSACLSSPRGAVSPGFSAISGPGCPNMRCGADPHGKATGMREPQTASRILHTANRIPPPLAAGNDIPWLDFACLLLIRTPVMCRSSRGCTGPVDLSGHTRSKRHHVGAIGCCDSSQSDAFHPSAESPGSSQWGRTTTFFVDYSDRRESECP